MDPGYWMERCRTAEAALAKARAGVPITRQRQTVLSVLGDLRQGEWIELPRLCELLQASEHSVVALLRAMEKLGLVERTPGHRGVRGAPSRWRLGYLVQVEASE